MNYKTFTSLSVGDIVLYRGYGRSFASRWRVSAVWHTLDDRPLSMAGCPIPAIRMTSIRACRRPITVDVSYVDLDDMLYFYLEGGDTG